MTSLIRAWFAAVLLVLALAHSSSAGTETPSDLDATISALLARATAESTAACDDTADRLSRILCAKTLRVGVRGDYSHFAASVDGRYHGYEIDLATRIAQRLSVAVRFVRVSPVTRLPALGDDKVDLVIATMGHTVDRDGQTLFIRPHYYASKTVIVGPKAVKAASWAEFAGATVCVTVGNNSNTEFVEHNVRLLLFDTPNRLQEQLQQGHCTFVAQDDSFFAAAFAQPEFAVRYEVKLAFRTLPWGMAVGQGRASENFARFISLLSATYHRDGVFITLAEANHVDTNFLQKEQAVWRRPECDRPAGIVAATCVLPPLDNRPVRLLLASDVERLEDWVNATLGLRISLPMFKTVVAFKLFQAGVVYTLLLVFGAIACTVVVAFGFGAMLWAGPRPIAITIRWLALFFRSSPIVLLLFVGFTVATAIAQFSLTSALIVSIVTLGLFNGSYGAQAVADVRTALVEERDGVPPPFRLLASRAAAPLTGFLINASKGSAAASMIGTPELVSATTDISSFSSERLSLYVVLLLLYLAVVLLVIGLCNIARRLLRRVEAEG